MHGAGEGWLRRERTAREVCPLECDSYTHVLPIRLRARVMQGQRRSFVFLDVINDEESWNISNQSWNKTSLKLKEGGLS